MSEASIAREKQQDQQQKQHSNTQNQITPFEVLKVKVYPVINEVILKLIDQIVKSQQVQKHEQRLKKKKLIDELQRKYIQRQIQKQELGSDYEESDDQQYYKKLQMQKEDVEKLINQRIEKSKSKSKQEEDQQILGQDVFNPIQFIIDELKQYQKDKLHSKISSMKTKMKAVNNFKNLIQ